MAKKKKKVAPIVKHPGIAEEIYYDESVRLFLCSNGRGGFTTVGENQIRSILTQYRFSDVEDPSDAKEIARRAANEIMFNQAVSYAGPIAGYPVGVIDTGGARLLVSSPTSIPEPQKGRCEIPLTFFRTVYGMESYRLFWWLKAAIESYRMGPPFRPSQCLALIGRAGSGKSFTQTVISEIFGGRSSKAYAFLSGKTEFNGNLVSACHLIVEDDQSSMDPRHRRALGTSIKGIVANHSHRIRRMHREAFDVSPFWRLTISLNDEPENMAVLPPFDESIKDKITALHATGIPYIFNQPSLFKKKAWWEAFKSQLPAFVYFLDRLEIPAILRSSRYGVKEYHTQVVLDALDDISEETALLAMIRSALEPNTWENVFVGTAADIEKALASSSRGAQAKNLLTWPSACGVFLSRLVQTNPDVVSVKRSATKGRVYTVRLDVDEEED